MNLNELHESKKTKIVKRALREHYDMHVDFDKLNVTQSMNALSKVRGLINEARKSKTLHESHQNSAYLKLVMMEQALSEHLSTLRKNGGRIIVENEEVQKSQVILAAQDMVDSIQKMLEQVSKMNVEELPAVVNGVQNEFGMSQGESFNQTVSTSLSTLQQALTTARTELTGAVNGITGQGSPAVMGAETPAELPAGEEPELDLGGEEEPMPAEEPEETEEEPELSRSAGRERR